MKQVPGNFLTPKFPASFFIWIGRSKEIEIDGSFRYIWNILKEKQKRLISPGWDDANARPRVIIILGPTLKSLLSSLMFNSWTKFDYTLFP